MSGTEANAMTISHYVVIVASYLGFIHGDGDGAEARTMVEHGTDGVSWLKLSDPFEDCASPKVASHDETSSRHCTLAQFAFFLHR